MPANSSAAALRRVSSSPVRSAKTRAIVPSVAAGAVVLTSRLAGRPRIDRGGVRRKIGRNGGNRRSGDTACGHDGPARTLRCGANEDVLAANEHRQSGNALLGADLREDVTCASDDFRILRVEVL